MMNLREIQSAWNALVPLAQARGIRAKHWAVPPQTVDRGMRRLNWLRSKLGITVPQNQMPEEQHSPGAALPPIRDIVAQYNALIPQARERGIRNARIWTGNPSTSLRGMQRLQWLRQQLGQTTAQVAPQQLAAIDPAHEFDLLTWGVEIEAMLPLGYDRNLLAADIRSVGIACVVEVLTHETRSGWKIVTDGSLGNYARGIELVSPVLNGQNGFEQLQKVCAVLKAKRVKVSVRCGLHVHVGWKAGVSRWKAKGLANVVKTYLHFESVIDSHMAESRRGPRAGNGFCNSNRTSTNMALLNSIDNHSFPNQVISVIGQSAVTWRNPARYRKLNLQPLIKQGTIEFRHHHGTVEYDKINNWVRFCLRLVLISDADIQPDYNEPATLANLTGTLRMPENETEHFRSRVAYFENRERRTAARRRAA